MTTPFLSIVTRCSKRPKALRRCVASVRKQTCLDAEQIFLVDRSHRGLKYANEQFYRYRRVPSGEYVWALDDDDLMNDRDFILRVRATARETEPDVILVKTIHEHTGKVHPGPGIWDLDWEGGERCEFWVGGGYCVVVKREVWVRHLENYYEGQDVDWATGGDWHFITSLIDDPSLAFVRCDVIAGRQPGRGYGRKTEHARLGWFQKIEEQLKLDRVGRNVFRIDHRALYAEMVVPVRKKKVVGEEKPKNVKPLNILQLARWDWAGCAYMLARAITEHTPHKARAVRWKADSTFGFPADIVSPKKQQLVQLWNWADVVHIHDSAPIPHDFPPKPVVLTMHGSKYRNSPDKFHRLAARRGWLFTVATPDLTSIHGAPWMPDTRFGLPKRRPITGKFTVIHCPSIRANKGTKHVLAAMEGLADVPEVEFKLIENMTWSQCVAFKAGIERGVLIDQFEWGYGCNAIEAWRYGLPVIANATGESREAHLKLFRTFPFYEAQPHEIEAAVRALLKPRVYKQYSVRGQKHVERYHAPEAAARRAIYLYRRARKTMPVVEIKSKNMPMGIGSQGFMLLRYCGRNEGRTTWRGPVTEHRYQFSASDRYRYVDSRDVPQMLAMTHHTRQLFEVVEEK